MIRPGEVYIADFPDIGPHPIIDLSREELNRGKHVMAVTVTSAKFSVRSKLANCVAFRSGEHGFTSDCVAQCENTGPVPVDVLDAQPISRLPDPVIRDVIKSIGYVIAADCEPV